MSLEIPTQSAEQGPRFPTLEEIQLEMQRLINRSDYKEGRKVEDESGIRLHEVTVVGEDGITCLYTYRKADGGRVPITGIDVAYCNGSPDDNDFLPGGYNVSAYDEITGRWTDTEIKKEPSSAPLAPAEAVHVDANETEMTKEKFEGLLKEANVQSVYTLFDIARTQGNQCQMTLEMIYTQLLVLNISNSSASKQYRLDTWDSKGKLTEAQFTAFTTQFRELSGIAGAEITKESIKNGLTEIHEEIPAQERVHRVIELFDTAEALLETTDIPTLEARERESMGLALTKRAAAKAFADRITSELIKLNRTFGPPATLDDWNPAGDIPKDQFNELSRRRKILANAVGSLNTLKIRHDLNDV
ncbi:MAG: hypothetical protein KBD27_02110 [Candidatus Moranbacteria bacterium]|nr:hypothetical protein [Candidatus Moranbacteria bacterium]